jgi:hypothetical protein
MTGLFGIADLEKLDLTRKQESAMIHTEPDDFERLRHYQVLRPTNKEGIVLCQPKTT